MTESSLFSLFLFAFRKWELVAGFEDLGYWKHWLIGQVHCSTTFVLFPTTPIDLIPDMKSPLKEPKPMLIWNKARLLWVLNIGFLIPRASSTDLHVLLQLERRASLNLVLPTKNCRGNTGKYLLHCIPDLLACIWQKSLQRWSQERIVVLNPIGYKW